MSQTGSTARLSKAEENHEEEFDAEAGDRCGATIAAPTVVGITAGTANARPRDMQCLAYTKAMDQSHYLATVAYQQGDKKAGDDYSRDADRAYANLVNRKCLS